MPSKRKAANMDIGHDTWTPPENPFRMVAESGTFSVPRRILTSCSSRAARSYPALAKDMATARLSMVAVRSLIKKLKKKKPNLAIADRTDLMILERKLKVSEAFQNGYFGQKLKDAVATRYQEKRDRAEAKGQTLYGNDWEEERSIALAYYHEALQELGMELSLRDWKEFEMDLRADFDNDNAEEGLFEKVKKAYEEGEDCRKKRRKLALCLSESSGKDAPMFEGSSSNFGQGDAKSIAAASSSREFEPESKPEYGLEDDKRYQSGKPDSSLSEDVGDYGQTETIKVKDRPSTPPPVQHDVNDHLSANNNNHHNPTLFNSGKAPKLPVSTIVRSNGRVNVPEITKPKYMSALNRAYAGVRKRRGNRRKTSPSRDAGGNTVSAPKKGSSTVTDQRVPDSPISATQNQIPEMHPDRNTVLRQQTQSSTRSDEVDVQIQARAPAPAPAPAQAHARANTSDENTEFNRFVAESEATLEAEAIAKNQINAFIAAGLINPQLEPEHCRKTSSYTASDNEHSGAESVSESAPILKKPFVRDDGWEYEYEEAETYEAVDTVTTLTGFHPNNVTRTREESEGDKTDACNGFSAVKSGSPILRKAADLSTNPPTDDVDKAYYKLISTTSKTWIRAVKSRISSLSMEDKWKAKKSTKPPPPRKTYMNHHGELAECFSLMDRVKKRLGVRFHVGPPPYNRSIGYGQSAL